MNTPTNIVKLNTAYIANLNRITPYHKQIQQDLSDRSFPCIISNDIIETPDTREYPLCSPLTARGNIMNKISTLRNTNLAFFLLFMDDSLHNDIASFELGIVINNPYTTVILVGSKERYPIHFIEPDKRLVRAYDYDNFVEQRFGI